MKPPPDSIVLISPNLEKFFGCSGRMLKPSPATVAAWLQKVPPDKLITMDQLRKDLAAQFQVEVTCPFDTKQVLKALAQDKSQKIPYWRVLRANGELLPYFPGGMEGQAVLLREAGFSIETRGKTLRVKNFRLSLVSVIDNR